MSKKAEVDFTALQPIRSHCLAVIDVCVINSELDSAFDTSLLPIFPFSSHVYF